MSERIYLFLIGATVLFALYFEIEMLIYGLCLFLIFEGVTNLRLTTLSQQWLKKELPSGLIVFNTKVRFNFDALLAWRILVVFVLGGSFMLLTQYNVEFIWFVPWFMGFAILGAGISGVCPALLVLRWLGFR